MQHAFSEREDVKYIYGITFGIRHQMLRIRVFLDSWWKTKAIKYNLMIQAIPLLIVWELWKARCSCKYGDQRKLVYSKMAYQIHWSFNLAMGLAFPNAIK